MIALSYSSPNTTDANPNRQVYIQTIILARIVIKFIMQKQVLSQGAFPPAGTPLEENPCPNGNHLPSQPEHYGTEMVNDHPEQRLQAKRNRFERYCKIVDQKQQHRNQTDWIKLKDVLERSIDDPVLDRGLGAIFGATIGDALGAYCQFYHSLDDKVVKQAMKMEGGGTFGLEAGQFTDDSELATHLLKGLSKFNENEQLSQKEEKRIVCNIGLQYVKWMEGGPFDIGNTTRTGISTLYDNQDKMKVAAEKSEAETSFLDEMFKDIYDYNKNSMANGSLMRISPFAFFFALIGEDPLKHAQFIKDEIRLTHPNKTLAEAGVCWVNILTELINRPDNSPATFSQILENNVKREEFALLEQWFDEASKTKQEAMKASPNMGFAKIGFSYGLRVLHYLAKGLENRIHAELYQDWMFWIIKRAGDTDTNGAIAGGLMGSVLGFWDLPQVYVARSLKTITDDDKFPIEDKEQAPQQTRPSKYHSPRRPSFYEPCNVLLTALRLVDQCREYKLKFSGKK